SLALYHKILPPTIKVEQPAETLTSAATPFYVNTEARPWIPRGDHPRRAGVSALGFGGSNFHCLLEEYQPEKKVVDWDGDVQIIPFSATDDADLKQQLSDFDAEMEWLQLRVEADKRRQKYQSTASSRLILVVEKGQTKRSAQLQNALAMVEKNSGQLVWETPDGIYYAAGELNGTTALLFPGQGAQYPDMLKDLVLQFPDFLNSLVDADRAFAANTNSSSGSLTDMIYPQPQFNPEAKQAATAALQATEVAQPALGAVSLAAGRVLAGFGVTADAVAGHSYGELVALCAAEVFNPTDLHDLSRLRGELMASGNGDRGSMVAVSASLAQVEAFLAEESLDLVIANRNTPEQAVLSGATAEIETAIELLNQRGISNKKLAVAAAFHSQLIAAAAQPFAERLQSVAFKNPRKKVFSNTTGVSYPGAAADVRDLLAEQLASPVDFVAEIESMYRAGIRTFIEVGPGGRLTGMVKAILGDRSAQALALDSSNGRRSGINDLARMLAKLSVLGHAIKLSLWDDGFAATQLHANQKKKGITVSICGANYYKKPEKRPPLQLKKVIAPAAASVESVAQPVVSQVATTPSLSGNLQEALRLTQQSMQALQSLQEQTSKLHQQFLEGQQAATQSFMRLVDQQRGLLQGSPSSVSIQPPLSTVPPVINPVAVPVAPVATSVSIPTHAPESTVVAGSENVAPILLDIIAEKTGYPVAMLELEMALDTDLGIDSIKRVEILSALQEKLPSAPVIRPEDLGALQTLGQIVDYLGASVPVGEIPLQTVTAGVDKANVSSLLLAVIAEKTGYPVEMLELEMALDTDLGIDSIKRVEIFSALQEKLPELPAVRPEDLGVLQTLGQIIDHLCQTEHQQAPQSSSELPQLGQVDRQQVATVLLDVIAAKTGYPVEMLELEMALDTDLGIDSIKRVEILSALQERLPGAPAIKPEHLGTLQTVGQIVDFLASISGNEAGVAPRRVETAAAKGVVRQVLGAVPLPQKRVAKKFNFAPGAEVWITDDGSSLADSVCSRLTVRQLIPRKISVADIDSIILPENLAGLVLLAPLKGADDVFIYNAFKLLQKVEPALHQSSKNGGAFFATVSRVDGCFGLATTGSINDPLSGGLAGLSKTAALEWPTIHCKTLDLAMGMEILPTATAIVDEVFTASPLEVGISTQGLHALELVTESLAVNGAEVPVQPGDLIVISGGARGVTAAVAVALSVATQATLLLLGRTPLPDSEPAWLNNLNTEGEIKKALIGQSDVPLKPLDVAHQYQQVIAAREIRTTLEQILNSGGTAIYRSVDLRNQQALDAVVNEIREQYGPVRGLIHGAGVLADKLIKEKTIEQFEQVYSTKVDGLRALLGAVGEDDLKLLVMFSSSTGRFGRIGQVDYAVANEILNKIADQQAEMRPDCRVLSLNWGPWDGGMVTPALKKVFAQEGIDVIDLHAGADYLLNELSTSPGGPVELVILGGDGEEIGEASVEPPHNICVSKAFDLDLDVEQYPFLKSHVIDGKAVLPMAIIVEWLAHGAIHNNPGLKFQGFNDLRILKGVTLEPQQSVSLQVMTGKSIKGDGVHVVPVELTGVTGQGQPIAHARAKIVLASRLPDRAKVTEKLELPEYPHSISEIYQPERLFHGDDFHGIREIIGASVAGISALTNPAPAPGRWIEQPLRNSWFADPLALDSSFQMLILWSFEQYQAGSLPVFAGRYRQYQQQFPETGVEIRVQLTQQNNSRAIANIDFVDPLDNLLVARIEDYECIIDASLNATFQRNKLIGVA
ncbi:MAG: SDR family NAD(P)-dependent oxidoreductase, partial [Desulfuromusa sp.]|nr:SDR family NAD(P)-dependent oxidoreductase [Desulfuromusa sp.]